MERVDLVLSSNRPASLGMGVVAAPHYVADADLVTHLRLAPRHARSAECDVLAEGLGGRLLEVPLEVAQLLGLAALGIEELEPLQVVGHPVRGPLAERDPELREAREDTAPQHERERPRQPEVDLHEIGADGTCRDRLSFRGRHRAEELLHGCWARVEVDRHLEILAGCPEGVVLRVVIGREVSPHGRKQHAGEPVSPGLLRLLDCEIHVPVDGNAGESDAAFRRCLDELGHEAIVRVASRPHQLAVRARRVHAEAGAERWCIDLGHAVWEEHFGDDAIVVEDLVARGRVPCPGQFGVVTLAPLLVDFGDEEVVAHALGRLYLNGKRGVEGAVVLRVDVGAVIRGVQSGVAVRGDDEIAIHVNSSIKRVSV